jgi:hypothetical protein
VIGYVLNDGPTVLLPDVKILEFRGGGDDTLVIDFQNGNPIPEAALR